MIAYFDMQLLLCTCCGVGTETRAIASAHHAQERWALPQQPAAPASCEIIAVM
jgi:hypothetical protein